jgi:hypothetical protein
MLTVPKVKVVSSDEGFSVEVLQRVGIEYTEGSKTMFVDSEILMSGYGIAVSKKSIQTWRPPHDTEKVTAEDRDRILDNIRRAIEFQGEKIQVVGLS